MAAPYLLLSTGKEVIILAVIEGVDLTGKTTLVERVEKLLGGNTTVHHAVKPTQHPLLEYESPVEEYTPGSVSHMLLDRWHVGERVWPHIYGRPTEYDNEMHRHVELLLVSRGALLVLAEARESAIIERLKAQGEARGEDITPEQISNILLLFKRAVKYTLLSKLYYDFERDDMDDAAMAIIQGASRLEAQIMRVNSITPRWIGFPRPDVLYVGEQVANPAVPSQHNVPFVPYKNTSGWYLMKCAPEFDRIAVVNALKPNGDPEDIRELWFAMGFPRIVALGNTAHAVVADHPHGIAPHPQYVRRFYHRAINDGQYRTILNLASLGEDMRGELRGGEVEEE